MLRVSENIIQMIQEHGRTIYPEECCGLLLGYTDGSEKIVKDLYQIPNARTDQRQTRYLIAPEDYKAGEQKAKANGLEILGVYHSHPDHPARPSAYDFEHALPWFSYLILSVERGLPSEMTSWVMDDERSRFESENIVISKTENNELSDAWQNRSF